jgi:hypothetical protein
VFVVYGRNDALREAMFAFLRSINLNPVEWSMAVAMTQTGSPYVGDVLDAAFARVQAVVVLLTPDEIAYLQPRFGAGPDDPETRPAAQARPNVLFEAGMAIGRHPKHTVLVEVGDMRAFSDVTGRHAIRMTNEIASRQELANRLTTAGCAVILSGTDWHRQGDFNPPAPPGQGLQLGRRTPSTQTAKRLDFDARYSSGGGGGRAGRLQIINRGTETALDVKVELPEDATLSFLNQASEVPKIPGHGKSVTMHVWDQGGTIGGLSHRTSFDMKLSAHAEDGEPFSQDVFLDANGG